MRWWRLALVPIVLAAQAACDDTTFEVGTAPVATGDAEGWCAVTGLFDAKCLSCHSAAVQLGSLDLETDPYNRLTVGSSAYAGRTLVVPGDPASSFLVVKLNGDQTSSEGGQMPLGSALPQDSVDLVSQWITDGATQDCGAATTPTCDATNEGCKAGVCEHANASGSMLPGSDCLGCHTDGGPAADRVFTVAGTVFTDALGTGPAAGVQVHIVHGKNSDDQVLTTNDQGNFFTEDPISPPIHSVSVDQGDGTSSTAPADHTSGACNACHNCSGVTGAAQGKLHYP